MPDRMPYAYVRRSFATKARPGYVSYEDQLTAVKALAAQHGDELEVGVNILEDWGKSGRDLKLSRRKSFQELERLVKAGQVSVVYLYDLSRLGRSTETTLRFVARVCQENGTVVRCAKGLNPDPTDATGRFILTVFAAINELQAEQASERALERVDRLEQEGRHLGPAPYGFRVVKGELVPRDDEFPERVVVAYEELGSYAATARFLNMAKVPTRTGGEWGPVSVRDVVQRHAGGAIVAGVSRGRAGRGSMALAGLLYCPCGSVLTGRPERIRPGRGTERRSYQCRRAAQVVDHPWPRNVREDVVLEPILRAVERLHVDRDAAERVAKTIEQHERSAELVLEDYYEHRISRAKRDDLLAKYERLADRARRSLTTVILDAPEDLRAAPAGELNSFLRKVVARVDLNERYRVERRDQVQLAMPELAATIALKGTACRVPGVPRGLIGSASVDDLG